MITALITMEEAQENIVAMVKKHPDGIPLKKLALYYNKTYHKNLSLSMLHFDSMASLVASLHEDLVVEQEVVFHRDHCSGSRAVAGPACGASARHEESSKASEDNEMTEKILKNVVDMIKEHPNGLPLKKVTSAYNQKYHHNLSSASLGYKRISRLVRSLEDLVVRGDMVFHKIHLPQNQPQVGLSRKATEDSRPATPRTPESLTENRSNAPLAAVTQPDASPHCGSLTPTRMNLTGSSVISTGSFFSTPCIPVTPLFPASKPAKKLTQQKLYQRVLEVSDVKQMYRSLCMHIF
ncbi:uncharacterized protein LOC111588291 isoform X2 [Amphiprion ocellaris]|uniref:uncharacterized protein LOC111588291 isoform X2 n=1 Tax=Amphiprion ocellaris TaxID=80972 RepID=UPI00241121DD|nr:uncharacterized protein LOC111588291 isoform X2 [Amphiprion ocellaris]